MSDSGQERQTGDMPTNRSILVGEEGRAEKMKIELNYLDVLRKVATPKATSGFNQVRRQEPVLESFERQSSRRGK